MNFKITQTMLNNIINDVEPDAEYRECKYCGQFSTDGVVIHNDYFCNKDCKHDYYELDKSGGDVFEDLKDMGVDFE